MDRKQASNLKKFKLFSSIQATEKTDTPHCTRPTGAREPLKHTTDGKGILMSPQLVLNRCFLVLV